MIDDPFTEGPNISSNLIGCAQGTYIPALQSEMDLTLTMNLVFVDGKYNGSTLAVLGRDETLAPVRELPVLGGDRRLPKRARVCPNEDIHVQCHLW